MEGFIIYQLKVAVSIAVFYLLYRFVLRRETLHRLNRIVLIMIPILSLILPFCVITVNRLVELPSALHDVPASIGSGTAVQHESDWWWIAATVAYAVGVMACLVRTGLSILAVYRLMKSGRTVYSEDGFKMSVVDEEISPCSWMDTVILSAEDHEEGNPGIMAHEKAHIEYGHTWDVIIMDLLAAFQWFNPTMWMLGADLKAVHEYEADAAVVSEGTDLMDYLHLLVAKAADKGGLPMANSFNSSVLRSRISMLSKPKSRRAKGFRLLYSLPLICIALAVNAEEKINYVLPGSVRSNQIILNHDGLVSDAGLPAITIHKTRKDSVSVDVSGKPFRIVTDDGSDMLYVMDNQRISVSDLSAYASEVETVTIYNDEATISQYRELFKTEDSFSSVVVITSRKE